LDQKQMASAAGHLLLVESASGGRQPVL
jgi:hypothetical protein